VNPQRRASRGLGLRLAALALISASVALAAPGTALASGSPIKLALLPVGQAGSFFDLTMTPGETRSLAVTIADDGGAALAVRSYAADVYTIINGGFGARLRDEPVSGMTNWLDYPTVVQELQVGQVVGRTFRVSVPADAGPGEYISSLVLENDQPIQDIGAVAVNQIMRQAVAVVVTVPGPRAPALSIGAASQIDVAGTQILSVAVANTGNVRLKPLVDLTVFDVAGVQVSHASVQMDTFYAHTDTFVQVPMTTALSPGAYSVSVKLDDIGQHVHVSQSIPLVITAPVVPSPAASGAAGLAAVSQPDGTGQTFPTWAFVLIAALLLVSAAIVLVGRAWLRRRRVRTRTRPGTWKKPAQL
jgi:hypothetical protein